MKKNIESDQINEIQKNSGAQMMSEHYLKKKT